MPDRSRKKRPRDTNRRAFEVVRESVGEVSTEPGKAKNEPKKDPAAVALGRKGGLKGGKARAAKLTPEQRSELASLAAQARWRKSKK